MIWQWFRELPKWFISIAIIVISGGLFLIWYLGREPEEPKRPPPVGSIPKPPAPEPGEQPIPEEELRAPIKLDIDSMFLAGNSVYQISEEGVQVIEEDWLENSVPEAATLYVKEDPKRLILSHDNKIYAYGLDGRLIRQVFLSDGGKFDGYPLSDLSGGYYQKKGDIWYGDINWVTAKIINEKQITNQGYFQGNPLTGRLQAAGDKGMVYKDLRLGMVWVNLETGAIEQIQLPATRSTSPAGHLIAAVVSGRPATFAVFDANERELTKLPIPQTVALKGLAWVGDERAAITVGNQIMIYDHQKKAINKLYSTSSTRAYPRIITPSPDGNLLLVMDPLKGLLIIDSETGDDEVIPLKGNLTGLDWAGMSQMLISLDDQNSELRGTWFYKAWDQGSAKRLFAQPMRSKFTSSKTRFPISHFPALDLTLIKVFNRFSIINTQNGTLKDLPPEHKLNSNRHLVPIAIQPIKK